MYPIVNGVMKEFSKGLGVDFQYVVVSSSFSRTNRSERHAIVLGRNDSFFGTLVLGVKGGTVENATFCGHLGDRLQPKIITDLMRSPEGILIERGKELETGFSSTHEPALNIYEQAGIAEADTKHWFEKLIPQRTYTQPDNPSAEPKLALIDDGDIGNVVSQGELPGKLIDDSSQYGLRNVVAETQMPNVTSHPTYKQARVRDETTVTIRTYPLINLYGVRQVWEEATQLPATSLRFPTLDQQESEVPMRRSRLNELVNRPDFNLLEDPED